MDLHAYNSLHDGHIVGIGRKSNDPGVSPENPAFVEEIFGPAAGTFFIFCLFSEVISLTRFASEEDAIRLGNASSYGLGGATG